MNEEIKKILENLVVKGEEIPVAHLRYYGDKTTFVTWTIISEQPIYFGNDVCLYSEVQVDIDVFSDKNYLDIVKEIKKRFINNEWYWADDSAEMFEEETNLYHLTITFGKEKETQWLE